MKKKIDQMDIFAIVKIDSIMYCVWEKGEIFQEVTAIMVKVKKKKKKFSYFFSKWQNCSCMSNITTYLCRTYRCRNHLKDGNINLLKGNVEVNNTNI